MKHGAFTAGEFLVGPVLTNDRRVAFSVGIGAAISSFPSAYVNNRTGDDVHGDGSIGETVPNAQAGRPGDRDPAGAVDAAPAQAAARAAAEDRSREPPRAAGGKSEKPMKSRTSELAQHRLVS